MTIAQLRAAISSDVRENEPMAKHTTFKIGGPAEFFFEAKTADDAVKAAAAAKDLNLPFFIFGGGSNMIVSDRGIKGLVVKMVNRGFRIEGTTVIADAGAPSGLISMRATEAGLTGLEWMVGLPGTIGGAVRGNAGMFGGEVKDSIVSTRVLKDGVEKTMANAECGFAYRESIFKKEKGYAVLQANFGLTPSSDIEAGKALLKKYLLEKKEKQPIEWPCAGCIFVNWRPNSPDDIAAMRRSLDIDDDIPTPLTPQGTVPAGWIIDKGLRLNGTGLSHVKISEKHGNFMVQDGKGTADEVIQLIAATKMKVRDATHGIVLLETEVEFVGF